MLLKEQFYVYLTQIGYAKSTQTAQKYHLNSFLNYIIKEGLILRFEYTHELAWNVMKYFLVNTGNNNIFGSKDATR